MSLLHQVEFPARGHVGRHLCAWPPKLGSLLAVLVAQCHQEVEVAIFELNRSLDIHLENHALGAQLREVVALLQFREALVQAPALAPVREVALRHVGVWMVDEA